jgi:hypothetical protein
VYGITATGSVPRALHRRPTRTTLRTVSATPFWQSWNLLYQSPHPDRSFARRSGAQFDRLTFPGKNRRLIFLKRLPVRVLRPSKGFLDIELNEVRRKRAMEPGKRPANPRR